MKYIVKWNNSTSTFYNRDKFISIVKRLLRAEERRVILCLSKDIEEILEDKYFHGFVL